MSIAAIRAVLETVMDPEIPVISVVDLGIVRGLEDDRVIITPTYSGCPAPDVSERSIREGLDADRDLPALRLDQDPGNQPFWIDALQGPVAMRGLPGTIRPLQVSLISRTGRGGAACGRQGPVRPSPRPPVHRESRRKGRAGPLSLLPFPRPRH